MKTIFQPVKRTKPTEVTAIGIKPNLMTHPLLTEVDCRLKQDEDKPGVELLHTANKVGKWFWAMKH